MIHSWYHYLFPLFWEESFHKNYTFPYGLCSSIFKTLNMTLCFLFHTFHILYTFSAKHHLSDELVNSHALHYTYRKLSLCTLLGRNILEFSQNYLLPLWNDGCQTYAHCTKKDVRYTIGWCNFGIFR